MSGQQHVFDKRHAVGDDHEVDLVVAVGEAIGSYIHSHPVTTDRVRQLKTVIKRNRRRLLAKTFYVGTTNYTKKISKEKQEFPKETIGLVEIEKQLREKP